MQSSWRRRIDPLSMYICITPQSVGPISPCDKLSRYKVPQSADRPTATVRVLHKFTNALPKSHRELWTKNSLPQKFKNKIVRTIVGKQFSKDKYNQTNVLKESSKEGSISSSTHIYRPFTTHWQKQQTPTTTKQHPKITLDKPTAVLRVGFRRSFKYCIVRYTTDGSFRYRQRT